MMAGAPAQKASEKRNKGIHLVERVDLQADVLSASLGDLKLKGEWLC